MKDRNENNLKKSLTTILAVCIIVAGGIAYAYFNKDNIANKTLAVANYKNSIKIKANEGTIKTLNNVISSANNENIPIKVDIQEQNDADKSFEELMNGQADIIITSRLINEEEKGIAEANNIKYREFMFGYVQVEEGENYLVMLYVDKDKYENEQIKTFIKQYYQHWYEVVDTETLGGLYPEIYEAIGYYLELLDIYPEE